MLVFVPVSIGRGQHVYTLSRTLHFRQAFTCSYSLQRTGNFGLKIHSRIGGEVVEITASRAPKRDTCELRKALRVISALSWLERI